MNIKIANVSLVYMVAALVVAGIFALATAASGTFLLKHCIFLGISLSLIAFAYTLFELHDYKRLALALYWVNIGLLMLLKVLGTTVLGSQRWLRLGPISVQPSEIAKICLIIFLAYWLSRNPVKSYIDIVKTLGLVALPAGLVLIQPDLGTTLVYGAISLGMLFWGGASIIQLLILISPLVTAITSSVGLKLFEYQSDLIQFTITLPSVLFIVFLFVATAVFYRAWLDPWRASGVFILLGVNIISMIIRPLLWGLLKTYQQQRLTIFLDPHSDPLGAGYHIIQSLYAIGSGGILGKGFKAGNLTQGNFVPEQHTDFIFSAIGEEFGLLGTLLVVVLYALMLIKIVQTAYDSSDKFHSLICVGIFSMLTFHIFINLGMNLSLMPITGVPLPFISYGGTSMLVDVFLLSLVLKVAHANLLQAR